MNGSLHAEAKALIFREARLLDQQDFASWLDLYAEDALYWMPAWRDDNTLTEDPDCELSLIFYRGKNNLRDRIDRLISGLSPVSRILPRVVHLVSGVAVEEAGEGEATVRSSFVAHAYDPRTSRITTHFGLYEHGLVRLEERWLIGRKIIRLANDLIPTVLDVNAI